MDSLRHTPRLTPEDVLKVVPGMFWDHDCVMLPGLGGFVCNPRSAWYDEAKRQIVPPSRDVLFNPRLTTNDGVVANELMAKHGLPYGEALKAVESLVDHVLAGLDKGETVEMPGLGKLYREEDQQLRFMADVEFEQMLQSFGHASIPLAAREAVRVDVAPKAAPVPMASLKNEEPREAQSASTGDTPVIPFRVKLGRAAAAVAIPLTLAGAYLLAEPAGTETLLGSNPLWNAAPVTATYAPTDRYAALDAWEMVDEASGETVSEFVARTQWEGLLEYDLVAGRPAAGGVRVWVPAAPEPAPESASEPTREVMSESAPETMPTPVVEPVVDEPTTPEVEAPVVAPEPQPEPVVKPVVAEVHFLIVGGAFGVPANAEKLAQSMKAEGFETSLHFQSHNQLTIVAMGGYATEEAARVALEEARAKGHQKAWLKRL